MSGYIIDPAVVNAFLDKPYNLKEAWDKAGGQGIPPADQDQTYTPGELSAVFNELNRLYADLTHGRTPALPGQKRFILSAGGPGAGKSTLLEDLVIRDPLLANTVFADPDERALKLMEVYAKDTEAFGGGLIGIALAYTKWRWASNFISGSIMNQACRDGYNILHGTTATSPQVAKLYDNARAEGYELTTLIVAAPDDVRVESARRRFEEEQTRFTNDTTEKGKMFYERLPLLMEKTDDFRLYWREQAQGGACLVAEGQKGAITVHDAGALAKIEADIGQANPALTWPKLIQAYQMPH